MKTTLEDLQLFLRIAEVGSLKQVASELMAEPSTVTRRLSALEERLNIKLIERSKVHSHPTEAGAKYYEKLKPLLEELAQVESEVSGIKRQPQGLLRVSCPVDFGAKYVALWMHELQEKYPSLRVELLLSDSFVNLIESGIDVAIRVGMLDDSSLKARHLGDMHTVLVASPNYFAQHGTPETPDDLEHHRFVLYTWLRTPTFISLTKGQVTKKIKMMSRFSVNNVGAIARLVQEGAGMHLGPRWLFQQGIDSGALEEVLVEWDKPVFPVHALYTHSDIGYLPAKIRTFIDTLVEKTQHVEM